MDTAESALPEDASDVPEGRGWTATALAALLSMTAPLLAIGAILCLVFAKPKTDPTTKET